MDPRASLREFITGGSRNAPPVNGMIEAMTLSREPYHYVQPVGTLFRINLDPYYYRSPQNVYVVIDLHAPSFTNKVGPRPETTAYAAKLTLNEASNLTYRGTVSPETLAGPLQHALGLTDDVGSVTTVEDLEFPIEVVMRLGVFPEQQISITDPKACIKDRLSYLFYSFDQWPDDPPSNPPHDCHPHLDSPPPFPIESDHYSIVETRVDLDHGDNSIEELAARMPSTPGE